MPVNIEHFEVLEAVEETSPFHFGIRADIDPTDEKRDNVLDVQGTEQGLPGEVIVEEAARKTNDNRGPAARHFVLYRNDHNNKGLDGESTMKATINSTIKIRIPMPLKRSGDSIFHAYGTVSRGHRLT